MKKLKTKPRGITLIALVITIIVLLILAGITVAQLSGNGLFDRTKVAKEKYKNSQEDEEDKLSDYENEINKVFGSRNISEDKIREIIHEELNGGNYPTYPEGTPVLLANVVASSSQATTTAPGDGWLVLQSSDSSNGNSKQLELISGVLRQMITVYDTSSGGGICLPCKSGCTIKYRVWGNVTGGTLTYIPLHD